MNGKQRIQLSMLAEKQGLCSYYLENVKEPMLVISKSKNEIIDPMGIENNLIEKFSNTIGYPIKKETVLQDCKLFGVEKEWQLFLDELKLYGKSGFKRREETFTEFIIDLIRLSSKYVELMKEPPILMGKVSKPFTIASMVYRKENENNKFISFDIIGSIFLAYYQLGIINKPTWSEFAGQFTSSKFLLNNKKLRVKIFGKLDPGCKTHNVIINNTILPIWDKLKHHFFGQLIAIEGDEIVITTDNYERDLQIIKDIQLHNYVRVLCYSLTTHMIEKNTYFSRHFLFPENKKPDIKCANIENKYDAYVDIFKKLPTT